MRGETSGSVNIMLLSYLWALEMQITEIIALEANRKKTPNASPFLFRLFALVSQPFWFISIHLLISILAV